MNITDESLMQRIKNLEKENRIIHKQLQRSISDRAQIEDNYSRNSYLLQQVIRDLEGSKSILEERGVTLELALHEIQNLQSRLVESEKCRP